MNFSVPPPLATISYLPAVNVSRNLAAFAMNGSGCLVVRHVNVLVVGLHGRILRGVVFVIGP